MARKHDKAPEAEDRELEVLAAYYERQVKYDAFDKLVDMALDGVITMEQAKTAWESEVVTYDGNGTVEADPSSL